MNNETALIIVVVAMLSLIIWTLRPSGPSSTPKWMSLFLLVFLLSAAIPDMASYAVQVLAVVGAFALWFRRRPGTRAGARVVPWVASILLFWGMLVFHPNVPTVEIGIMGMAKTTFCVAGLVAGASISTRYVASVELTVIRLLQVVVTLSIVLHTLFPQIEQSIGREAGKYTASIGGELRLQGVFAGPFHMALAGLVLLAWGMARFRMYRNPALISLAVGAIGLYLTLVRSAYVALGLVILVSVVVAPNLGKVLKRVLVSVSILGIGSAIIWVANPSLFRVVDSIGSYASDDRFLGRVPGYKQGLEMFIESPLIGWGSGAAGDTLGTFFEQGHHVTSHNIFLKIAVEGGIIGVALWIGMFVSILRSLPPSSSGKLVALGPLMALIGIGMAVASLETMPISYLVFFIIGLVLPRRKRPEFSSRIVTDGLSVR